MHELDANTGYSKTQTSQEKHPALSLAYRTDARWSLVAGQEVILTTAESELIRNLRIIGDDDETEALIGMTRDRIIAERASKKPAFRLITGGAACK